jgi:hypothetical protein
MAPDFYLWQVEKGGEAERKELSVALAEKGALLEELQEGIKAVQVGLVRTIKQLHTFTFLHKHTHIHTDTHTHTHTHTHTDTHTHTHAHSACWKFQAGVRHK